MAFVAEDGTGLADANSLCSVAFADTHHGDRGHARWENFDTTKKQEALVRATDHVERVYTTRFRGFRETDTQALQWPRGGAWDRDGYMLEDVPVQVCQAVSEYALRALELGELTPDPPSPVSGQDFGDRETVSQATTGAQAAGSVKSVREKIGPIEEETRYAVTPVLDSNDWLPMYPAADMFLTRVLRASGRLIR